jgi:hypothetical protein
MNTIDNKELCKLNPNHITIKEAKQLAKKLYGHLPRPGWVITVKICEDDTLVELHNNGGRLYVNYWRDVNKFNQ